VRRQIAEENGDPHSGSAAKKGRRAAILAQWLVDTYGVPYLNSGSGDVQAHGLKVLLRYRSTQTASNNCHIVSAV
jgi:hypothetical protein